MNENNENKTSHTDDVFADVHILVIWRAMTVEN